MKSEGLEVTKVRMRVHPIKKLILRCADENEVKMYRSQLQRKKRRLS